MDATGSSRALKGSLSLLRGRSMQDAYGSNAGNHDLHSNKEVKVKSAFEKLREKSHYENSWHGPRLIAQGSYADPIEINYYDLFNNEVGFVVPRVHETKDVFRAMELLSDQRFDLNNLHSRILPVCDAPAIYQELAENPTTMITACFDWKVS